MPITKEQQDALVDEALAKEGLKGGVVGSVPRVSPALAMLVNALSQAKIALDMIIAEQSAKSAESPVTKELAQKRLREVTRPKTFSNTAAESAGYPPNTVEG